MIEFHVFEVAVRWDWTLTVSRFLDGLMWGLGFMAALLIVALILKLAGKL